MIARRLSLVFGGSLFLLLTYNFFVGQDLNWDQLNYHYYAGYVALNPERVHRDFFAASIQSYLVPYSFVPFYFLVSRGLEPLAVSSILVGIHAINVALIWLVARNLSRGLPGRSASLIQLVGVVTGILSPIFLTEVGSSFNDIIASIPVIAGFAALTGSSSTVRRSFIVGLFSGVAIAIKLTSVPFVIGLGVALVFEACRRGLSQLISQLVVFVVSVLVSFGLVAGYWTAHLWFEFGNPIFPFFNKLFLSPDYIEENIRHFRYLPHGLADFFARPFLMAMPAPDIYTETFSPDIRFALFFIVCIASLCLSFMRKTFHFFRVQDFGFLIAFFVGFLFWLLSSGNGRYLMPLGLLVGPALAISLSPFGIRLLVYGSIVAILIQCISLVLGTDRRWSAADWQGNSWFEAEFTDRFVRERSLYLSVDLQPSAFVVPFANRDSAFVNVIGQNPLSLGGPGGNRLKDLFSQYAGAIRVYFPVNFYNETFEPQIPVRIVSDRLKNFGFIADFNRCEFNLVKKLGGTRIVKSASETRYIPDAGRLIIASCPLSEAVIDPAFTVDRDRALMLFADAEKACPLLMEPIGLAPYFSSGKWEKFYVNSDISVQLDGDLWKFSGYMIPPSIISSRALLGGNCPSLDRRDYGGGASSYFFDK